MKKGFTLAEVLITMTIIGVVAALTTPALFHNAGTAQVGPKLAKIKSTIENANRQLMQEEEVGSLATLFADIDDAAGDETRNRYIGMLSQYMRLEDNRGTDADGNPITKQMSTYYGGQVPGSLYYTAGDAFRRTVIREQFLISTVEGATLGIVGLDHDNGECKIFVDINGNANPNRFGKDIFMFFMDSNGMLTPYGDFDLQGDNADYAWQNLCNPEHDTPVDNTKPAAGLACTATIFENNLRVTYDD